MNYEQFIRCFKRTLHNELVEVSLLEGGKVHVKAGGKTATLEPNGAQHFVITIDNVISPLFATSFHLAMATKSDIHEAGEYKPGTDVELAKAIDGVVASILGSSDRLYKFLDAFKEPYEPTLYVPPKRQSFATKLLEKLRFWGK